MIGTVIKPSMNVNKGPIGAYITESRCSASLGVSLVGRVAASLWYVPSALRP